MSGEHPYPSAPEPNNESERSNLLRAAFILGAALVCVIFAIYLGVSLYKNTASRYAGLEPGSKSDQVPVEVPSPGPEPKQNGGETWPRAGGSGSGSTRATARNGALAAEVSGLVGLTFPGQRPLFFKAVFRNTGSVPIGFGQAEVSLLDPEGGVIEKKSGYSAIHTLYPGNSAPVTVLFSSPPKYHSASVRILPLKTPYKVPAVRPKLLVTPGSATRNSPYGYTVTGTLTNQGSTPVGGLRLAALLYDSKGGLVGGGLQYLGKKVLAAGQSESFSFSVTPVNGEVARVEYAIEGREQE